MRLERNQSLMNMNTFGIQAFAEKMIIVNNEEELLDYLLDTCTQNDVDNAVMKILGGGSNILLTQDQNAIIVKNEIKGIRIVEEDESSVLVEIGAGENWHDFVLWAVGNDYGGVENLSLIPGTVGAAPIQNIGAYGVEIKDVLEGVHAIHLEKKEEWVFTANECLLSYRNSIFKYELKGELCITRVYLRLTKINHHINIGYGAIQNELAKHAITNPSLKQVSDTIISIRQSKLPDPKILGNAGSFFKNPIIGEELFLQLKMQSPHIPSYDLGNSQVKIPAAWLIEHCGFKGVKYGNTGCFKNQPLVIVNYGDASGKEILDFSQRIQKKVRQQFNIDIVPEVNVW